MRVRQSEMNLLSLVGTFVVEPKATGMQLVHYP